MEPTNLRLTYSDHAARRAAQRGVPSDAVEATLRWGAIYKQHSGRTAFHLGRRAVSRAAVEGADLRFAAKTAVVLAKDGTVVTVIRTSDVRRLRRGRWGR